jgi:hypothetical protein
MDNGKLKSIVGAVLFVSKWFLLKSWGLLPLPFKKKKSQAPANF